MIGADDLTVPANGFAVLWPGRRLLARAVPWPG